MERGEPSPSSVAPSGSAASAQANSLTPDLTGAPSGAREQPSSRHDRLLPWIAAERGVRALFLAILGIVLVTHPHTNWAGEITHLAHQWGLDPSRNVVRKIIDAVRKVHAGQNVVFGVIALGYGALEAAESYGLARRRQWGEWLTLVATSILLIPEVWELVRKVTVLKLGALVVNLLVIAYLYWRLRRHASGQSQPVV
jgi:uncharacterized membrane protein (DUF2068 family)